MHKPLLFTVQLFILLTDIVTWYHGIPSDCWEYFIPCITNASCA